MINVNRNSIKFMRQFSPKFQWGLRRLLWRTMGMPTSRTPDGWRKDVSRAASTRRPWDLCPSQFHCDDTRNASLTRHTPSGPNPAVDWRNTGCPRLTIKGQSFCHVGQTQSTPSIWRRTLRCHKHVPRQTWPNDCVTPMQYHCRHTSCEAHTKAKMIASHTG